MEEEWRFACVIRGYHVYKDVWDPYPGDSFTTKHEQNNQHDKYTVAVLPVDAKSKGPVGHLPKEISKECCLFIPYGGTFTISGDVKDRICKTLEPCEGMEIPCEVTF